MNHHFNIWECAGLSGLFFTLKGFLVSVLDSFHFKLSILKEFFKLFLKFFKDDTFHKLPIVGRSPNIKDYKLGISKPNLILHMEQAKPTDTKNIHDSSITKDNSNTKNNKHSVQENKDTKPLWLSYRRHNQKS